MANEEDIAQIVGVISAAYPNFNVSPQTIEVYYQTLNDIPADELKAAALHCIAETGRRFAPSVGELRGAVGQLRNYIANVPGAYQALEEVRRQIVDNGGDFGNPVWSSPLIERAVNMIGWRELRMCNDGDAATRARFLQCYEQLLERAARDGMLLPEVRGYLEVNGARLLAPAEQIKQLSERLSK